MVSHRVRAAANSWIKANVGFSNEEKAPTLLEKTHRNSTMLMWSAAAMAGLLFLLMAYFVIYYRDNISALAGLTAIFGTSIAALVVLVAKMSSDLAQTGMMLDIINKLPPDQAFSALKVLMRTDTVPPGTPSQTN